MNRFLSIIPRPVRVGAWIIVSLAMLIAVGGLVYYAASGGTVFFSPMYAVAALACGLLLATWLLGLGYVYADARRRAMRPVLWVLVAFLFPHLLGFLLYFVLRQPIAAHCPHCGNTVTPGQRFCSWCGHVQTITSSPAPDPVRP